MSVGGERYLIRTHPRESGWVACAERSHTGERFGIDCVAPSEAEAASRLTEWLDWQHEHAAALEALREAERGYHRAVAGSAFVNPTEAPTAIELRRESLDVVEGARLRLDGVRARQPVLEAG